MKITKRQLAAFNYLSPKLGGITFNEAYNTSQNKGDKMQTYVKIAFRHNGEQTAGLVIPFEEFKTASLSKLSRLFPYSEARKMRDFLVSPRFPTFEDAFAFSFEGRAAK